MPDDEDKIKVAFVDGSPASNGPIPNRFEILMEESRKFFARMDLHEDLMIEIYRSKSDWEFILKIDALLESATKEILKCSLNLKLFDRVVGQEAVADFVDSLPMNGRTSVLHLLRESGCPDEDADFIEAIRYVRNSYAHNIKLADLKLIELIKKRKDKSKIIKSLCNIKDYDEGNLIASYEKDGGLFRFAIVDATMRVLLYAFHIVFKDVETGKK